MIHSDPEQEGGIEILPRPGNGLQLRVRREEETIGNGGS